MFRGFYLPSLHSVSLCDMEALTSKTMQKFVGPCLSGVHAMKQFKNVCGIQMDAEAGEAELRP